MLSPDVSSVMIDFVAVAFVVDESLVAVLFLSPMSCSSSLTRTPEHRACQIIKKQCKIRPLLKQHITYDYYPKISTIANHTLSLFN